MEYDYIVIGIGGIGSAALYWLTRLAPNAKILGLEQFKLGHVRGGSQDVSRIIRKMYPGKAMTDFAGHSYAPWAEIEKESGLKLVTKCGGLYWTSEESGYMHMVEDIRDAMRASGQDVDFLRSDEIERRWPQIQFRGRKGAGILDPEAGLVDAAMANGAHQTAAVRRGATILEDARVRSVQNVPGGIEVETTRGTFTGRRVVVSSGAWVNEVLATTGNRIPVKVSQENVTYLASLHLKAFTPQNFPVFIYIDADVDLYALPVHGIPGFKIGVDAGGNETTGDNRTWTPDPVREKRVLDFVHRFMPKAEGRVIETKTCLYTMTLDRTFVVDSLATRGYPDLLVVCGAGHAFKFAALLGKIMAQLAIDGQTEYDISQFKFERPAITDPNFKPAFVMRTAKKPAAKIQSTSMAHKKHEHTVTMELNMKLSITRNNIQRASEKEMEMLVDREAEVCRSWGDICGADFRLPERLPLTLAAYSFPPFVQPCFTHYPTSCPHPGLEFIVIHNILTSLGFPVRILRVSGQPEMLQAVTEGRADFTGLTQPLIPMGGDSERTRGLARTASITSERPLFIVAARTSANSPANLIYGDMNSVYIWGFTAGIFVLLWTARRLCKVGGLTWASAVGKVSMGLWSLGLSIFFSMYGNLLAIIVSRPTPRVDIFSSLLQYSELIESGECRLVTNGRVSEGENYLRQFINPAETHQWLPPDVSQANRNLRQAFRKNPPLLVANTDEMVDAILAPNECRIGLAFLSTRPLIEAKYCGLRYILLRSRPPAYFVYYFNPRAIANDSASESILLSSQGMRLFHQRSVQMEAERGHQTRHPSCFLESEELGKKRLKLVEMLEPFVVLFFYSSLAALIFLGELATLLRSHRDAGLHFLSQSQGDVWLHVRSSPRPVLVSGDPGRSFSLEIMSTLL